MTMIWSGEVAAERSFAISSWLFARALGVVLLIAFVSLGVQSAALFHSDGITPIATFVSSAKAAGHHALQHPSLFWWSSSDRAIAACWWLGVGASFLVVVGFVPRASLMVAWLAYMSFVSVGWPFMSFQWDTLLLETTFTAAFVAPWCGFDRLRTHREPNRIARFALWWLLFRLIFRSGYVKLASGDPTWADLTALQYHYWSQPLPTVLGWYAAQLPTWFQKLSCLAMFAIELGAPFLIWIPLPWARRAAAAAIGALMLLVGLTGSYGFFNLLTVVLCIPLLDDRALSRLPWFGTVKSAPPAPKTDRHVDVAAPALIIAITALLFFVGTFGGGPPRWLAPLYPFGTFNNYGLFAVMTTERREIELEGTRDGETWIPYVFKYKPGSVDRAPVLAAPHQPRLDWQMWFAALGEYRRNAWLADTMRRLLEGNSNVVGLLEEDPFVDEPPKQVRAIIYRYEVTSIEERRETGNWWTRDERALYAPILGVPIGESRTDE
jgi:hypothetical protein